MVLVELFLFYQDLFGQDSKMAFSGPDPWKVYSGPNLKELPLYHQTHGFYSLLHSEYLLVLVFQPSSSAENGNDFDLLTSCLHPSPFWNSLAVSATFCKCPPWLPGVGNCEFDIGSGWAHEARRVKPTWWAGPQDRRGGVTRVTIGNHLPSLPGVHAPLLPPSTTYHGLFY